MRGTLMCLRPPLESWTSCGGMLLNSRSATPLIWVPSPSKQTNQLPPLKPRSKERIKGRMERQSPPALSRNYIFPKGWTATPSLGLLVQPTTRSAVPNEP